MSPGAGASAFSQPASSTSAVEAARIMRIFIIRLLLPSKPVALDKFPLSREYLRIKLRLDIAARQGVEPRPPRRRLARAHHRDRSRSQDERRVGTEGFRPCHLRWV